MFHIFLFYKYLIFYAFEDINANLNFDYKKFFIRNNLVALLFLIFIEYSFYLINSKTIINEVEVYNDKYKKNHWKTNI